MPLFDGPWSHLTSRIAMLLGLSALSAAGAEAGTVGPAPSNQPVQIPQQSAKALDDLLLWQDDDRIFVSEPGRPAEELHFANSTQRNALRQLLAHQNATAATPHLLRDRIILVGGGGSGLHMEAIRQSGDAAEPQTAPKLDLKGKGLQSKPAAHEKKLSTTQLPDDSTADK